VGVTLVEKKKHRFELFQIFAGTFAFLLGGILTSHVSAAEVSSLWAADCTNPLLAPVRRRQVRIQKPKMVSSVSEYWDRLFNYERNRDDHPKMPWALDTDVGGFLQARTRFSGKPPVEYENLARAFNDLIRNLMNAKNGPVHYADYGGHLGIPLRHLKRLAKQGIIGNGIQTTLIDLFDWSLVAGAKLEKKVQDLLGEWVFDPEFQPNLLLADATKQVNIDPPIDFATAFSTLQFMEDKLAALIHMYNQLSDQGIMVVANDDPIGRLVTDSGGDERSHLLGSFLRALGTHGISVALTRWEGDPTVDNTRAFLIQKRPGTSLRAVVQFSGCVQNNFRRQVSPCEHSAGEVISIYEPLAPGAAPVIVEETTPPHIDR
jgi:hypothetical protein